MNLKDLKINNIVSMKFETIEPEEKIEITSDSEYKKVTKEEFTTFISNFPTELETDIYAVCEPALITYNDFSRGPWPQSIVARTWLYDEQPGEHYYCPLEERSYYILK